MSIQHLAGSTLDNPAPPTRADALLDLSILGVPSSSQGRMPGISGFPCKFSPDSRNVWVDMVQDPEFKAKCRVWGSLELVWHNTIQEFLRRCSDSGVYPFEDQSGSARNEYVQEYVRRARIHLVSYIDESKLFERVRVRKAYRNYTIKENGLVINSWAELFHVEDPSFEKWLTLSPMPRFIKSTNNKYVRVVQPNVVAWVKYLNASRVTVGFDIEVPGSISVTNKKTPSRKQVNQFLDNVIFLPVVRAHRFSAVKNRLF